MELWLRKNQASLSNMMWLIRVITWNTRCPCLVKSVRTSKSKMKVVPWDTGQNGIDKVIKFIRMRRQARLLFVDLWKSTNQFVCSAEGYILICFAWIYNVPLKATSVKNSIRQKNVLNLFSVFPSETQVFLLWLLSESLEIQTEDQNSVPLLDHALV